MEGIECCGYGLLFVPLSRSALLEDRSGRGDGRHRWAIPFLFRLVFFPPFR